MREHRRSFGWAGGSRMPLSRRGFLRAAGAGVVGASLLPAVFHRRKAHAAHFACGDPLYDGASLTLVRNDPNFPYPFFDSFDSVMLDDPEAFAELYQFAEHYRTDPGIGTHPAVDYPRNHVDFWFRYLPVRLFESALSGVTMQQLSTNDAARRHLWMMHLVGYYGGIWFGKKLDEFNPVAFACQAVSGESAPPTEADFASLVTYLERAVGAAYDQDSDLVSADTDLFGFCRWALRFGDLLQPLIVLYGYNVGYTNNILVPPYRSYPVNATTVTKGSAGADPYNPPYNSQVPNLHKELGAEFPRFSEDPATAPLPPRPAGPFEPTPYLTGDSPALAQARLRRSAVENTPAYQEVVTGDPARTEGHLLALQAAAFNVGNATWSIPFFLDVKHWDARSYHQIVSLSVFFVQAVQAAGLACLATAAEGAASAPAVGRARDAALAAALVQPFGGSYLVGLNAGDSGPFGEAANADHAIPHLRDPSGACITSV